MHFRTNGNYRFRTNEGCKFLDQMHTLLKMKHWLLEQMHTYLFVEQMHAPKLEQMHTMLLEQMNII